MQETLVQFLDWEDPLEKEMATQSIILAWEIPWTEKPGGLQFMELQRVGHDWVTELNWRIKEYGNSIIVPDTLFSNSFYNGLSKKFILLKIQLLIFLFSNTKIGQDRI